MAEGSPSLGRRAVAVVVLVLAVVACAPAYAEGTWLASVTVEADVAVPGESIAVSGSVAREAGAGSCIVVLDDVVLDDATCEFGDGVIAGSLVVPADTLPDRTAAVSVCWPGCYDESFDDVTGYWQANAELPIVAARFAPVPDVRCRTVAEATEMLAESELKAVADAQAEDVVTEQEPTPGGELDSRVPVVLLTRPVEVPDLRGLGYSEAESALEARCLGIETADGATGGSVTSQGRAVGELVPGGTLVPVTFGGPAPEPVPEPETEEASFPLRPVGAGLLVLLVLALASWPTGRWLRGRRDLRWLRDHVAVVSQPGPRASYQTDPTDSQGQDHVITIVPRSTGGTTTVEERA